MKLFSTLTLRSSVLAALCLGSGLQAATAQQQAVLGSSKDSMMFEDSGSLGNGAGFFLIAGRTGSLNNFNNKRGLIAFDVAGSLPAGATVNSATLTLYMRKTVAGPEPVTLYRVTQDWGEGTAFATGGNGAPATPGDVTWTDTFFPGSKWNSPGGDFLPTPSATLTVDQIGSYSWSSAQLTADVQGMLDNPQNNFGWILIGNETGSKTTKMFGTKEGFASEIPFLTIDYSAPGGTTPYCTAGTSASGCQATLSSAGSPSASAATGFVVSATGVEGAKDGLYFFGSNGRQSNPWGSGTSFNCVTPPVARGGLLLSTGTSGLCDGAFSQDLNARWASKPPQNPGAGAVTQIQLWYRDPLNTSNQTTSMSNALEFTVGP